jgi:hypothetical protein
MRKKITNVHRGAFFIRTPKAEPKPLERRWQNKSKRANALDNTSLFEPPYDTGILMFNVDSLGWRVTTTERVSSTMMIWMPFPTTPF